jgi:nucleoside-diphosphate-sugar epimerase
VNIVVTGAGGFLGGALVERLLAHGVREVGVVTRPGGKRTRLDEAASRHRDARLRFIEANVIAPADARKAVEGADVVYHLAAAMKGAPADMYLNGVVGTKTLLEAIAAGKRKTRVVLVSSFGVYGVADQGRGAVVNEDTPLESHPERRDVYSQVKLRQEQLARELAPKLGLDLVVLRPGVIYGPGGSAFSSRVGLNLFGVFLSLGGSNLLPLSYVDNCAEAIVVAGQAPGAAGQAYNVNDDDLPTCRDYLREYKKQVTPVRSVPVPYPVLKMLSVGVERYHRWSKGQLPAIFTPYKSATTWGGNQFDNSKIKTVGWKQLVPTEEGMRRTFEWLRSQLGASH